MAMSKEKTSSGLSGLPKRCRHHRTITKRVARELCDFIPSLIHSCFVVGRKRRGPAESPFKPSIEQQEYKDILMQAYSLKVNEGGNLHNGNIKAILLARIDDNNVYHLVY